MNAPFKVPAPTGTREELRDFIAENLSLMLVHIEHAVDDAHLGSDAALGFALRAASAHFGAAVGTYGDLSKEDAHG